MAQLIIPAAGAAIGFALGGPTGAAIGWGAGSFASALLAPKPPGPSPLDTKWTGLEYGTPIPWFIGTMRLSAIPIYLGEKVAVEQTAEGGKGGDEVTTGYEYYADVMFLIADNESAALLDVIKAGRRAWTSRSDATAQQLANSANSDAWEEIRFYGGADDQLPDPDYEADVGVGLAPAYIGRTTVFIKRLHLDGNAQLPQLHFVPTTSATSGDISSPSMETLYDFDWADTNPPLAVSFGSTTFESPITIWGETRNDSPPPTGIKLFVFQEPLAYATGGSVISIAGVGIGGVTPYGGAGDTNALVFNVGDYIHGVFDSSAAVQYERDVGTFASASTGCYIFSGDTIWINAHSDLFRYSKAAGGLPAAVNSSAESCRTLALFDGYIYGADPYGSGDFVQWDQSTLSEIGRWPLDTDSLGLLCTDEDGVYDFAGAPGSERMVRWNSASESWDVVVNDLGDIGDYIGQNGASSNPRLIDGYIYLSRRRNTGISNHVVVRALYRQTTYTPLDVDLADVVTELHVRAGQSPALLDVSDLVGTPVNGVIAGQVQPVRQVLQQLATGYYFDRVESGGLIKYVGRGQASVVTIPFADLGVGVDGAAEDPLTVEIGNDLEVPNEWVCKFISRRGNRYEPGAQHSDRLTTDARGVQTVSLGIAFSENEAKGRAQSFALDAAVARTNFSFALGLKYAYLEPTDVVTLTARSGTTYRARIVEVSEAQGVLQCKAVLDDPYALRADGVTVSDESPMDIAAPGETSMVLLDIAALQPSEVTSLGHLVAVTGTGTWSGASIRRSIDGADFSSIAATVTDSAVAGTATSALSANPPLHREDLYGSLTVRVIGNLSSSTRSAMQADRTINVLAVETSSGFWEVIRFRTATLTGTDGDFNLYTLTGLQRGRRGSESLVGLHASGDRVVLLRASQGLRNVSTELASINLTRYWRGVTLGRSIGSAATVEFADTGVREKPFAPAYLRVARDGSNNATVTLQPRTRAFGRYGGPGGSVIPAADADSFSIDVYADDTFTTVVRTLAGAQAGISYTAAQQATDGLTPGAPLNLRAYQVSTTVGRGYALEAEA